MSSSTIIKQPEFATKFLYISVDENSYAPGTEDVLIAGKFNIRTGQLDSDGNEIIEYSPVSLFVGTGGTLTFLQSGRSSGVPGNYTVLKNIPSGSFLPIICNRILIKDLPHIYRYTRLVEISALQVGGLSSVAVDSYNKKQTTTSGSGTGLEIDIHVFLDDNAVKRARLVVSSRDHVDYAVGDTITVASGWDGGSAPALTHTLTSDNIGTVPATTASDIQIYF